VQQASIPIIGAKFLFEGREFVAGSDGFAVIPFMIREKRSIVAASAPGGYACSKSILFIAESWNASIHIIAPHESYVPGCSTSIMLRCALSLSSQRLRMPLSELRSPSVSLDALDENNAVIQSSSTKVAFNDSDDLLLPWMLPAGCCTLNVTLNGTVALRSSVNGTSSICAVSSAKIPFAPQYDCNSDYIVPAAVQSASTRSQLISPHLRLGQDKYWLDVGYSVQTIFFLVCVVVA
jgi:hypothetical protein